jgi:hypothetical protein
VNTLQSSALPLDAGGFVVTVVAPTESVFKALLRAINTINPDAFQPVGPMDHTKAAALQRDQKTVYAHVPPFVDDEEPDSLKNGEAYREPESYGGSA